MQIVSKDGEMIGTSTPAQQIVQDHNFQTPRRGAIVSRSSGSSSNNSRRFVRTSSEISRTPSSGPRLNPFDSHLSVDKLHLPTCSPSVFSIVVSPSQDQAGTSSGSGGKFWSLDQQARLFPAQISDDSPWKQESAVSRLIDQATEEAIDLYFSQNHQVTTPEDVPLITANSLQQRSILMDCVGNSPNLTDSCTNNENEDNCKNLSGSSSISYEPGQVCRSTQTCLSFPKVLPVDLENVLTKYGLIDKVGEGIRTITPSTVAWGKNEGNVSNSTLRRKLFAGMIPDDEAMTDSDTDDLEYQSNILPNCESTAMVISPGKVMMTPNAQRIPSPNKSVSRYVIESEIGN